MPSKCPANCLVNPDAVNKKDWKCVECGADLKKAFEEKKKRAEDFYKNQAKLEAKARSAATDAYNKVFKDVMKVKDQ